MDGSLPVPVYTQFALTVSKKHRMPAIVAEGTGCHRLKMVFFSQLDPKEIELAEEFLKLL
jgi:hypothetical protein